MGAFTGAREFFHRPLDEVAAEYGYSDDNLLILRGNGEELRARFPRIYQNIMSCEYQADQRMPMEYAQDLVASWLIEDYFLKDMSPDPEHAGQYSISLNGADRRRQILANTRVSASSDFMVEKGRTRIKLELMNNYTDYWQRMGILHLRDWKYQKMQESRSLFVAVAMHTREFAIFDFREDVPAEYVPTHKGYGYKPAYALSIPAQMFHPLENKGIAKAILALLS